MRTISLIECYPVQARLTDSGIEPSCWLKLIYKIILGRKKLLGHLGKYVTSWHTGVCCSYPVMNLGLLTLLPGIRLATLCNNFRRFCLCYYIHFCLGVYETWEVEENTHLMLLYHQRSLLVLIIACAVGLSVTFICPNFPFYCHRWNRWQQSRIMLFFFFLL